MGIFDNFKEALSGGNSKSPIAALGGIGQKYTDPLAWIGGDGYLKFINQTVPEATNKGLSTVISPFKKVDETINPVRWIGPVDDAFDWTEAKPADTIAAALGAYFGGGALLGAGGGGGAGGTAGGTAGGAAGSGSATSAPAAQAGSFDWQQLVRTMPRQSSTPQYQAPAYGGAYSGQPSYPTSATANTNVGVPVPLTSPVAESLLANGQAAGADSDVLTPETRRIIASLALSRPGAAGY